jgi:hypothetical protein
LYSESSPIRNSSTFFSSRTLWFTASIAGVDVSPIATALINGDQWQPEFTSIAIRAVATLVAYTALRVDTSEPVWTPKGMPGRDRPTTTQPDTYRPAPYDTPPPYDDDGNYLG